MAAQRHCTGPLLGKVFDWAFAVGKRVYANVLGDDNIYEIDGADGSVTAVIDGSTIERMLAFLFAIMDRGGHVPMIGEWVALPVMRAGGSEAVGDPIARNAWPARLGRDGTLHVATASAA